MEEKKRAPNFSNREKTLLLNLIHTYKHVIENKKTNAQTWRDKDEAWERITTSFNADTPEMYPRTKEALRKYYDNIKQAVRKEVAEEKKDIFKTGGGSAIITCNPIKELALGLMNPKTVTGLQNPFDSDSVLDCINQPAKQSNKKVSSDEENIEQIVSNNFEDHSYANKKSLCADDDLVLTQQQESSTSQLKSALGPELEQSTPLCAKTNWGNYSAQKLRNPISAELKHKWTKRRRPNIQQLSSSQLSEEYLNLARVKREVYLMEKENIVERNKREEEIYQLQKRKLEIDINIKEIELTKLKRSF